jgi:hypothetical protein
MGAEKVTRQEGHAISVTALGVSRLMRTAMDKLNVFYFVGSALIVLIVWAWWIIRTAKKKEIAQWNGGKHVCGKTWQKFECDTDAGRGYVCPWCNTYIWVSFDGVDRWNRK